MLKRYIQFLEEKMKHSLDLCKEFTLDIDIINAHLILHDLLKAEVRKAKDELQLLQKQSEQVTSIMIPCDDLHYYYLEE